MSTPLVLRAGPTGALYEGSAGDALICQGGALWASGPTAKSARYTPILASTNADAALGNGALAGIFYTIGKILHLENSLTWGTTSTFGTGALFVSLPTGFVVADVDALGLLDTPPTETSVGYGVQILAGAVKASPAVALLFGGSLLLALDPAAQAAIAPADSIGWALNIPLL